MKIVAERVFAGQLLQQRLVAIMHVVEAQRIAA
jgi:hypothetical protein